MHGMIVVYYAEDGKPAVLPSSDMTKLCKDCCYFGRDDDCKRFHGYAVQNPVTGTKTTSLTLSCSIERRSICANRCGVYGKYWQPK